MPIWEETPRANLGNAVLIRSLFCLGSPAEELVEMSGEKTFWDSLLSRVTHEGKERSAGSSRSGRKHAANTATLTHRNERLLLFLSNSKTTHKTAKYPLLHSATTFLFTVAAIFFSQTRYYDLSRPHKMISCFSNYICDLLHFDRRKVQLHEITRLHIATVS